MERSYHIRPARGKDEQSVKGLLLDSNLPLEGVDEHFEESYCVAESQDRIIGVAGIEVYGSHGLLRSCAVDSEWRKRSIGEALVKNRLSWARANELSDVYLITTDADHYFKRFGFRAVNRSSVPDEIKESSEFSTICPETATVMVRSVQESRI